MAGWTLQMGYPLLTVSESGDGELSLVQQRFLSDGSPGEDPNRSWKIPVGIQSSDGSKTITMLEDAEGTAPKPVGCDWVKINPGQTGVYRVRYSPELLAKLAPAVKDLSASDRIGLVDDAFGSDLH